MLNKANCEQSLPDGYQLAFHVNAKSVKLGIVLNLIAVAVTLAGTYFSVFAANLFNKNYFSSMPLPQARDELYSYFISLVVYCAVFFILMIFMIVAHELIHGISFKLMTGAKLTFGISWSCAFCGVPDIYVYRRASLKSAYAPMLYLSLLLLVLTVCMYFVNPICYIGAALLFWLHLGSCSGDAYIVCILMTKFKDKKTLVRDAGPEQFFYIPQ